MKEVEISPKNLTGLKSLLKAKDFGKSSRIAKEVLQMMVLELHCRPNFPAATSSPSLISTMEHENELKRATRGQTIAAEVLHHRSGETHSPSDPGLLPRARRGKQRRWR
jgi:hypothetical protein